MKYRNLTRILTFCVLMSASIPSAWAWNDIEKLDAQRQDVIQSMVQPTESTKENNVDLKADLQKVETTWKAYRSSLCLYESTKQHDTQTLQREKEHQCLLRVTRLHNQFFFKAKS